MMYGQEVLTIIYILIVDNYNHKGKIIFNKHISLNI